MSSYVQAIWKDNDAELIDIQKMILWKDARAFRLLLEGPEYSRSSETNLCIE